MIFFAEEPLIWTKMIVWNNFKIQTVVPKLFHQKECPFLQSSFQRSFLLFSKVCFFFFSVFVSSSFPRIFLLFLCSFLLPFHAFSFFFYVRFFFFNDSSFFWIFWLSRPSIFFQFRLTGCFWQNNFFWWYTSKTVKVFILKVFKNFCFFCQWPFPTILFLFFIFSFLFVRVYPLCLSSICFAADLIDLSISWFMS